MKKYMFIIIMLLSFVFTFDNVYASRTYVRGIVTSSSKITNVDGNQLKSDTGGSISLYSPEAVEILSEEGSKYKIKFMYSGFIYEGYINKSNVEKKTYTTDDVYEQALLQLGFPQDYASKLAVLHAIHPNWKFTPSFTGEGAPGMNFKTAIDGEASVVARNLIDSSNTSLRSTADGAYQNGQWISLSGSGWYAASTQTISFYMDPRNFLDESHIFMFENGGYNPATQTKDQVEKVLNGTFMTNPFDCFETSNSCPVGTHYYVDSFMQGAVEKKVNPIHMATRVKQEQGTNGSVLSLGKGYNGDYVGYYNFFNIGASGITTEEVITNGFNYAIKKNWNNQHISIYGGISFIGSSYISRGQATKYYEKFNTIAKSYYGNQYMQNVRAPYSEAYSTYTGYYKSYDSMASWDNGEYDFLIPIYSNMGEYTTLDSGQNGDSTLKSLSIEGCKFNPSFQSSAYNYDCYIEDTVAEVEVNAEATNPNASVKNTGKVKLNNGDTVIKVQVIAVNGTSSDYVVNVHLTKKDTTPPLDIMNNVGIKVSDAFASNIQVGSDVSNIINSVSNKYYFATVTVTEGGTNITEGIVKTGQVITISNAGQKATYKIVLYGDVNSDGTTDIRDLLGVQKHLVGSKILANEQLKASDINKDGLVDIRDLLLVQKTLVGANTISQG